MAPKKRSHRVLEELQDLVVKHARIEESGEIVTVSDRIQGVYIPYRLRGGAFYFSVTLARGPLCYIKVVY